MRLFLYFKKLLSLYSLLIFSDFTNLLHIFSLNFRFRSYEKYALVGNGAYVLLTEEQHSKLRFEVDEKGMNEM